MQAARRYAIIAGVVVLVLLVVGLTLAAFFNVLLEVLYVTLMLLALLMVLATLFQIYSIVMLIRSITTVRDEMKPLLASAQETIGLVKDTAKTAGHTVTTVSATAQLARDVALAPSVRAVATVVAARQMVQVFFGQGHTKRRSEQRRKQQMEAAARGVE